MFWDVSEYSVMFHVPGFIDALSFLLTIKLLKIPFEKIQRVKIDKSSFTQVFKDKTFVNCHIWFSNYSTVLFFTGSLGVERYTDVLDTQVEASKEESETRSNSKKSLAEIIFLSTVKTRRTAKL